MLGRKYIRAVLLTALAVALTPVWAQRRNSPPPPPPKPPQQQQNAPRGFAWQAPRGNQGSNPNPRVNNLDTNRLRGGDWLRQHQNLTPQQQQKALQSDPEFKKLPSDMQQRYVNRLQRFNSLAPNQQQRMLQRMDRWSRMSPEQRNQARGLFQQFRSLPDDRRKAMTQAFRNLRAFPPEQQQKMLNSPQYQEQFSDSERNILRGMSELNLGPHAEGEGGGAAEAEPQ